MPWRICGLVPLLLWQHASADRDDQQPLDNTFRGYAEKDEGESVMEQLKELQRHLPKVEQAAQATRDAAKKWAEGSLKEIDTTGDDLLSAAAVVAKNLKNGHQFIAREVMGLGGGPPVNENEAVTDGAHEEELTENKEDHTSDKELEEEVRDQIVNPRGGDREGVEGESLVQRLGQADAGDDWNERMPNP